MATLLPKPSWPCFQRSGMQALAPRDGLRQLDWRGLAVALRQFSRRSLVVHGVGLHVHRAGYHLCGGTRAERWFRRASSAKLPKPIKTLASTRWTETPLSWCSATGQPGHAQLPFIAPLPRQRALKRPAPRARLLPLADPARADPQASGASCLTYPSCLMTVS